MQFSLIFLGAVEYVAADVVCLALPGVTGGRLVVTAVEEGINHADNVGDLFNLMDTTLDAEKKLDRAVDTSRSAENAIDAGNVIKRTDLPSTKFETSQLQHEWKHSDVFGLGGNWNKENGERYKQTIQNHIDTAPEVYESTYRKNTDVYVYINRETRIGVYTDISGNYIGNWKLTSAQLEYHTTKGVKIE